MFILDLKPEELVDLKAGSVEPYNKIFGQVFPFLCAFINKLSKGTNDGKDIVQEALIKFYDQRTRFESTAKIMTWLHKTCINAYFNFLKHNKVEQKYIEFLQNTPEATEPAYIETVMVARVEAEMHKLLDSEIEDLSPKRKEIFKLLFFEKLPAHEVAVRLNIAAGTVSRQKDIAIQRLMKRLSNNNIFLMVLLATLLGLKFFSKSFITFDGLPVHYYIEAADQHTINHKFYPYA
jgi:RNA polymerase sigma-70 factor (ECF subfamily)